jgi:hypothetical protein
MSRLARAAAAGFALAVLAGGLGLPLLGLVIADEPAPFCCRGRCCCTGEPTDAADGRPCLRASCHCGRPDPVVAGAPLLFEAVLPAVARSAAPPAPDLAPGALAERPIARSHEPPVPPPRRLLPA